MKKVAFVSDVHANFEADNEDAERILAEASAVAEQRMREKFPEIPTQLSTPEETTESGSF